MVEVNNLILAALIILSILSVQLFSLVIYFIKNPEKAEKCSDLFWRTIRFFTSHFDKKTVAINIQSNINIFRAKINKEGGDLLHNRVKIEWAKGDSESFLKDGQIVLRLHHWENQDKNLIYANLLYFKEHLLPEAKPYLNPVTTKSIDLTMTKKALLSHKNPSAINKFQSEIVLPECEKLDELREHCTIMEDLDDMGIFSRILLKEMKKFGSIVFPIMPRKIHINENKSFIEFLHQIAIRESGIDVPLIHLNSHYRVYVMLVARSEIYGIHGIMPYVNRIIDAIDQGINSIYICGLEENNRIVSQIGDFFKLRRDLLLVKKENFSIIRPKRRDRTLKSTIMAYDVMRSNK